MSRRSDESDGRTPRLLVTAGPTHEPIDAVRYIGNRSSGRMGIALATEAAARNWPTTLLLGPTPIAPESSSHLTVIRFQTTAELQQELLQQWPDHDVLIMAAAVADFRPSRPAGESIPDKLRRTGDTLTITLEPTPDLLARIADHTRADQTVIGFALEPAAQLLDSARDKLHRKRADAIVANPLETMDAEDVRATVVLRDGKTLNTPAQIAKTAFAVWLLDQLSEIRHQQPQ